jgi:hypothetical protein
MAESMKLTWHHVAYAKGDNRKQIEEKLSSNAAINCLNDQRVVYVIKVCSPFSLSYPLQPSPVVYIGKGVVWTRLSQSHSKWISRIQEKLGTKFEVSFCSPRRKKFETAYEQVEADLIQLFIVKFGTLPLMNSRKEWPHKKWSYDKRSSRVPLQGVDNSHYCSLSLFDALLDLEEA